ncbi:MAG TPA: hypothetical protein PLO64_07070 [Methanothermobacter sp.]|nr:cobalamin biosynthesis protein N [Methanothermobacter sp. MT-2]HOK72790.1 hypothetical protein [Methanothermobacter sp.]HOL69674.1 hypothetical protein [Methanothermobacter sp.]HPQ05254.1 hypothetical protein [Methanothermobacter sp.]HPU37874.1 hypothetical protein [Methanothermobacter sp.]
MFQCLVKVHLYGVLEHPMVAAYLGGLSLAIEKVSGAQPSISNLRWRQRSKHSLNSSTETF